MLKFVGERGGVERTDTGLGEAVALSQDGNTALIGGDHAWVFTRSGETWSQQGGALDEEAWSGVALSGDGETALAGNIEGARVYTSRSPLSPPEFGRCLREREFTGSYPKGTCTSVGAGGSFEWFSGVAARRRFTTAITTGVVSFQTVKGLTVVCTGESGTGEYGARANAVAGVALVFKGCERLGEKCSSAGAAEGEIATKTLSGMLGVETFGSTSSLNKIGLDLSAAETQGPFMEFSCGSTDVSVRAR